MPRASLRDADLVYELVGSGPPLVMLHGAQSDRRILASFTPEIPRSFRVLTFDQRGSGESRDHAEQYTIEMLADDTAALMDHVGFPASHVLGMSMGGMIAQELALRHPGKVRSLVLGCTTPGGPQAVPLRADRLERSYSTKPISAEDRGRAMAEACFTPEFIEQHPEIVPAMILSGRQRPIDLDALGRRMRAVETHDTWNRLPRISCPTLVITGKQDVLIPADNSRLLAERIPGARLVVIESAGHFFWGEQPEASFAAILAFLRTLA